MQPLRIAHISDLHFSAPNLNPFQLFSKRWLGNLNSCFLRKKEFRPARLLEIPSLLKEEKVQHLIVTGDLSTTSHPKEFIQAQNFLSKISERGICVHTLPGNHDHYTRHSFKNGLFYKYFSPSLKRNCVSATAIAPKFWLVTLDTALATSLLTSNGLFSEEIEENLEKILFEIPQGDRIILANHFPFFCNESARKALRRKEALIKVIERHPQIIFYLHGHTHTCCIADLRPSGLPIVLDCGSTPHIHGSLHLIEIEEKQYSIKVYRWKEQWTISQEKVFHV